MDNIIMSCEKVNFHYSSRMYTLGFNAVMSSWRYRRFIITFLGLSMFFWGYAQPTLTTIEADSLENILETGVDIDSTKQLVILDWLSSHYLRRDLEKAKVYADRGLILAVRQENKKMEGEMLSALGVYFLDTGQLDSAKTYIQRSALAYKSLGNIVLLANSYSLEGHIYRTLGDYSKAMKYYLRSVEMLEKMLEESPEKANKTAFSLAAFLNNVIIVLEQAGRYSEAIEYGERAVKLAQQSGRKLAQSVILTNLGNVYEKKGSVDTALVMYHQALNIKQEVDDRTGMATLLNIMGDNKMNYGEPDSAVHYMLRALDLSKQLNYKSNLTHIYVSLVDLAEMQSNFANVQKYAYLGIKNTVGLGQKDLLPRLYRSLATNFARFAQYDSAYHYQNLYSTLKDSLDNQAQLEMIDQVTRRYEIERVESENDYLRKTGEQNKALSKRQTQLIIVGTVLGVVLVLLIIVLIQINGIRKSYNEELQEEVDRRIKELREANENLTQANMELSALNYIASHDIKEPIRNIGNYIQLIKKRLPANWQAELATDFKVIANSSRHLYTLVEDFSAYHKLSKDEDPIQFEQVDLNEIVNTILATVIVDKEAGIVEAVELPVIYSSQSVMYIIFKNLIENGLKYNESTPARMQITYSNTENNHILRFEDNGIGIDPQFQQRIFEMFKRLHSRDKYPGTGIGLAMVKLVLNKIEGEITVDSQLGQGSVFTLTFLHQSAPV